MVINARHERYLVPMLFLLIAAVTHAETDDRTAILELMAKAFDAVRSGNPDDWRAIQLAEGNSTSFRPSLNGEPGQLEMRMSQNEAFVANLDNDGHEYIERWTAEPTVLIRGPIAVVWGEYEFWVDGKFSHCGVDSTDFLKIAGSWKIANFMWTVEKDGCTTDPSLQH